MRIKKRIIFLSLLLLVVINFVIILMMHKCGYEYLALFTIVINLGYFFILKKNGLSSDSAISIVGIMIIIFGLLIGSVHKRYLMVKISDNHYSMLGVVIKTMKCHLDYYEISIKYFTQVDKYSLKHYDLPIDDYMKLQPQTNDTVLFNKLLDDNFCQVISWHPSRDTMELFQKPIKYVDGEEIGNDYYYYAKLRPTIALKNFGLNVVFKVLYRNDTILYYRNLNQNLDSIAHRLADTLQTASNRALVGDSVAFLFHDAIYSKVQVFEEIPQAKEYYLKYYKDDNQAP